MAQRYVETSRPFEWWPVLVECPRCRKAATAVRADSSTLTRISCSSCALTREGRFTGLGDGDLLLEEGRSGPRWWNLRTNTRVRWPTPQARSYRLWLRTECCGKTLWATNEQHLTFLTDYVSANLRERTPGLLKSSTSSWRLPTWMKDGKNRSEVLLHLQRLREALPS